MKIQYESTLEDLTAFNRYHCDHSPTMRKAKLLIVWLIPAAWVVIMAAQSLLQEAPEWVIAGVIVFALWVPIAPGVLRRSIDWQARRLFSEGANKGTLGPHELELTERDLIERTPYGEQRMRLEAIERVVSDGNYTFIYFNATMAHAIPHGAVREGDHEAFIEAVKQKISRTHA